MSGFAYKKGFTLLELLVTLFIAAILAAIAIPSFETLVNSSRMNSVYSGLIAELNYARSEAVQRNVPVAICASSDQASCNTNNWHLGRLVFVDINRNGAVNNGDTLLKVFPASEANITITSSAFTNTRSIVYNSNGTVEDAGTLFVCGSRGDAFASGVSVTLIGMTQRAHDSDNNGTIDDIDGTEVSCP